MAAKVQAAACSLPQDVKRVGRVKVRKLLDWAKDDLLAKARATCKTKQGTDSLFPIGRQIFSHLKESRAPSCVIVTWEDRCHHSKCPPYSLFNTIFRTKPKHSPILATMKKITSEKNYCQLMCWYESWYDRTGGLECIGLSIGISVYYEDIGRYFLFGILTLSLLSKQT